MAYNRALQHFTSSQELATIWETSKIYVLNQVVIQNNLLYLCLITHTSGTFATDLAAGKWVLLSGNGDFSSNGSVAMTGNLNLNSNKAINVLNPTDPQDAATKSYVDNSFFPNVTTALNDNTTTSINLGAAVGAKAFNILYSLNRNNIIEVGSLMVAFNGTTVNVASVSSYTGSTGISFSGSYTGGVVYLDATATSTGFNATMKYKNNPWTP